MRPLCIIHGGQTDDSEIGIYKVNKKTNAGVHVCTECVKEIGGREDKPEDIDEEGYD